jgi:hypothetical protein
MKLSNDQPQVNRCAWCGRFVGNCYTGYSYDSWLRRGLLWCDNCYRKSEDSRFEIASNEAGIEREAQNGCAPRRKETA